MLIPKNLKQLALNFASVVIQERHKTSASILLFSFADTKQFFFLLTPQCQGSHLHPANRLCSGCDDRTVGCVGVAHGCFCYIIPEIIINKVIFSLFSLLSLYFSLKIIPHMHQTYNLFLYSVNLKTKLIVTLDCLHFVVACQMRELLSLKSHELYCSHDFY